jgi:MazG family protein
VNYSWIIEDELIVSSLPESHTMLKLLKKAGVKAIASMCEIPFSEEELAEYGFHHINLLVPDYGKPTLSQLKTFIRWATFMKQMKQPVLVHCMAGYGRSATMCAVYLVVMKDMNAEKAINEIREIRSENSIETTGQEGLVHEAEYVREIIVDNDAQDFYNAQMIIDTLRKKCPWDAKQTSITLMENLLEEVYETWEAIKRHSEYSIASELGDVLLLVLMISRIESEKNNLNISIVINSMLEKLRNRHPHVFGHSTVDTPDEVLKQWGEIKREEQAEIRKITDIPSDLPPLVRADRVMAFVKGLGFDWETIDGVMEKLLEETTELKNAIRDGDIESIENELGDTIFTLLNLARFAKIKPEISLSLTLNKFTKRFQYIEYASEKNNKPIESMSMKEMDDLWNKSKLVDGNE